MDGVYCVGINSSNKPFFAQMLSDDLWESTEVQFGIVDNRENTNRAVGIVALGELEQYLELKYIFVAPEARNAGFGRAAFETMKDIASRNGLKGIICSIIDREQEELAEFLWYMGFRLGNAEEEVYSFKFNNINPSVLERVGRIAENSHFDTVSVHDIIRKNWTKVTEKNGQVIIKDRNYYDKESFVTYDKEQNPICGVLVKSHGTTATVEYIWNSKADNKLLILEAFKEVIIRYLQRNNKPDEIMFIGLNDSVVSFAKKIIKKDLLLLGYLRDYIYVI